MIMMQANRTLSSWLGIALALCVGASAMGVITMQHQSRKLFAANERAVSQLRQLDAELEMLVVEQRKLASPQRIEQVARTRLAMQPVTAARTLNVVYSNARKVSP
jgi:cell division protein FtsL